MQGDDLTAQQLYTAVMRDSIAPALRAMAFTGSNGRFELPDARAWALVGFQKDRYSTAALVRFCVNLSVIDKGVWGIKRTTLGFPEKPSHSTHYGPWFATARLAPDTPDFHGHKWWTLAADRDPQPVIDDLLDDFRRYGITWLQAELARDTNTRPPLAGLPPE